MLRDADLRILHQRAGLDFVRPAVPRARHDGVVVDEAFAERAGLVQAQVVDGVKLVAQAEQGDMAAADGHHLALARREVVDASDWCKGAWHLTPSRRCLAPCHFLAAGVSVVSRRSLPRM